MRFPTTSAVWVEAPGGHRCTISRYIGVVVWVLTTKRCMRLIVTDGGSPKRLGRLHLILELRERSRNLWFSLSNPRPRRIIKVSTRTCHSRLWLWEFVRECPRHEVIFCVAALLKESSWRLWLFWRRRVCSWPRGWGNLHWLHCSTVAGVASPSDIWSSTL